VKKILVAMSGGIDSSSAVYLLKKKGYEVHGAFMRVWQPASAGYAIVDKNEKDAREVARRLDVPFYVFDVEREFKACVVNYFKHEYEAGRTPNPCVICNKQIKFNLFCAQAAEKNIDGIATGHYVQNVFNESTRTYQLKEGFDPLKDQSYFLFLLGQKELEKTLFPLGQITKDTIRTIAGKEKFFTEHKNESQEICFIPHNDYRRFLEEEFSLVPSEGIIRDSAGKTLGTHKGYMYYTIGQRRGLGISAPDPLYVIQTDPQTNEVVIGSREESLRSGCSVGKLHWIEGKPEAGIKIVHVRIRYNQEKIEARISIENDTAELEFITRRDVVTPGQAAVFYDGEIVVGGGWIEEIID